MSDNAELQRVMAELEAERQKKLKSSWMGYGFLCGVAFCGVLAATMWFLVFKPDLERISASTLTTTSERESLRVELDSAKRALQTCKTANNSAGVDLQSYTLLYDSAVSSAQ